MYKKGIVYFQNCFYELVLRMIETSLKRTYVFDVQGRFLSFAGPVYNIHSSVRNIVQISATACSISFSNQLSLRLTAFAQLACSYMFCLEILFHQILVRIFNHYSPWILVTVDFIDTYIKLCYYVTN